MRDCARGDKYTYLDVIKGGDFDELSLKLFPQAVFCVPQGHDRDGVEGMEPIARRRLVSQNLLAGQGNGHSGQS